MIKHPAKYSDAILPILQYYLDGYPRVLDPFAGMGKLRQVRPDAFLLEIEPEWATACGAVIGDALALPWIDGCFDAICTSPCYGNRMADHHNARDGSPRNTYRHVLGRPLNPHNAGQLQWGEAYRKFHLAAWTECRRVLRKDGRFILNISDHIRDGKVIPVSSWHVATLCELGFDIVNDTQVTTPRQRRGANGNLRVDHENIYVFRLEAQ